MVTHNESHHQPRHVPQGEASNYASTVLNIRFDDSPETLAREISVRGIDRHYTNALWATLTNWNESDFAESVRTKVFPNDKVAPIMCALITLMQLESIVRHDAVAPWLLQSNQAFGGQRPADLIASGVAGREQISKMVIQIGEGHAS